MARKNMVKIKRSRAEYRKMPKGYYHLCTDGKMCKRLFHSDRHFAFVVNTLAIIAVKFDVIIYAYEIMPNHIHLILSCTGDTCVEIFDYLMRRISAVLEEDGYEGPPENYFFKLIPVENAASMRSLYVYLARNPYEKGICMPCSYKWGTGRLAFSDINEWAGGKKVSEYSKRELTKMLRSKEELPEDWILSPEIGVLPQCFVRTKKFYELFPTVKNWLTMLVKDYESCFRISREVDEEMELSDIERNDIVSTLIVKEYNKSGIGELSDPERFRLAGDLFSRYNMKMWEIASLLKISPKVVSQVLKSKDYGVK